ncbi:MAG TPA: thiamine-phosphate synthase family protein [Candidatus Nanoarchaeia archaeon]|nr:thiamine-phosphate synthase family protein [Candidatus Nanoarchaeia archaeon]
MIYMPVRCLVVKDVVAFRSALARKLHQQGYTQSKISHLLDVTQPMVSNYLAETSDRYGDLADNLLREINKGKKTLFSHIITTEVIPESGDQYIATKEEILTDEKSDILHAITAALESLRDLDCKPVLPEVKMNIAMIGDKGATKKDIASIPGGLIFIRGQLKTYLEPEFGASDHLASLLLDLRKKQPEIKAILNIKYSDDIRKRIRKASLKAAVADNMYHTKAHDFDLLIHKGSFGIEPISYVCGIDAMDAVHKLKRLL